MRFRISLCLALILSATTQVRADDYQPRNTQKPGEEPNTPEEAAAAITLPEGFQARLFAGEPDVRQPVAMALDDRGRLWVAESYSYKEWKKTGEDRILIFEDTDNDGRHDSRKVFWTGGNHVSGMTVGWGGVWVCESPNLIFIPDRDRDDVPDGEAEIVLDGWTTKAGHNFFNGLTWGIDGWLYGRHGITAPSSVGAPGTPAEERENFDCAIWRYHPVTKEFEVVCRGTTNPWGLDWNADGEMFFTNNVNGHLWHAIRGAFYPRMGNRDDPFAEHVYDRIRMTADHLHHAGTIGDWTKTRDGKGVHGELGGGHSHCGGMIYLGGKWPEQYRGRMFMANTHGRRINVDVLERSGSGYVAKHEPDFMQANNPWFRGVQLLYGPDGDVYVSDWTDLGECHDNDGVHRTSGRIYKIIFGEPSPKPEIDLFAASQEDLINYQLHDNEWYARTARHILQMRAAAGELKETEKITEDLRKVFSVHPEESVRLRLILTLHATGLLPPSALNQLSHDDSEFIRAWAIRLCTEPPYAEDPTVQLAVKTEDPSLLVRLAWASQLQAANFEGVGWKVAEQLASDPAIAEDPNLPLMIWYGIKDAVGDDFKKANAFLRHSKLPQLKKFVARRLSATYPDQMVFFLGDRVHEDERRPVLEGMVEGLDGRTPLGGSARTEWIEIFDELRYHDSLCELAWRVNHVLDPERSRELLEDIFRNSRLVDELRLALLVDGKADVLAKSENVGRLAKMEALRPELIRALAAKPEFFLTGSTLYRDASPEDRNRIVAALCSKKKTAQGLLETIAQMQEMEATAAREELEWKRPDWVIPRDAITAFHARQIQSLKDKELTQLLEKVWGTFKQSSGEKREQIRDLQNQLLPDVLATADLENGHAKFQQLCMACHTLRGEGNAIGPDLTGANRADVYYLLENIIDPSATLPQDFRLTVIEKKNGTAISGMVKSENEYALTLALLDREETVDVNDIAKRTTLEQSLMPEGLLATLKPDDVRDLIAFLQE